MNNRREILKIIENAIVWHRKNQQQETGVSPLNAAENPLEADRLAISILNALTKANYKIIPKSD
jgi:hypothetical protein